MHRGHSYSPADRFPRIMPSLRYNDVGRALIWLQEVFGPTEYLRWTSAEGVIQHAELRLGDGFVELASATEEQPSSQTLGLTSPALVCIRR